MTSITTGVSVWASAPFVRVVSELPPPAPSTAVQAVTAFYQAVNAHNYVLAYSLLGPSSTAGKAHERFAAGYQPTLNFAVTVTARADPSTVQVAITAVDSVPTGGTITRQFTGTWHLIPAQNSVGWLLDRAAITQVASGGVAAAPPVATPAPSVPYIPYAGNGGGPTWCNDGAVSHNAGAGTCSQHGGEAGGPSGGNAPPIGAASGFGSRGSPGGPRVGNVRAGNRRRSLKLSKDRDHVK